MENKTPDPRFRKLLDGLIDRALDIQEEHYKGRYAKSKNSLLLEMQCLIDQFKIGLNLDEINEVFSKIKSEIQATEVKM